MLNFFPTHGNEYVAAGGGNTCTYFTDRAGAQITTNNVWQPERQQRQRSRVVRRTPTNVARQRDKIVAAINTANADIVSLEELENSAKFGKSRDFAITELVNALNAGVDPGKWDFAPSPTGGDLPALADEDVIRTGFIYQPASVSLVGASKILVGSAAVRQRSRAAGPGVQEGRQLRQPGLRGDRQPLQVQGLGHRRRHRPGQRQPGPGRSGQRPGGLRQPVQDRPGHHPGLPRG